MVSRTPFQKFCGLLLIARHAIQSFEIVPFFIPACGVRLINHGAATRTFSLFAKTCDKMRIEHQSNQRGFFETRLTAISQLLVRLLVHIDL